MRDSHTRASRMETADLAVGYYITVCVCELYLGRIPRAADRTPRVYWPLTSERNYASSKCLRARIRSNRSLYAKHRSLITDLHVTRSM